MNSKSLPLESLDLPQDLYWNGKMEPTSPPSGELFPISESAGLWLIDDYFANDIFVDYKHEDIKTCPSEFDGDFNHEEEVVLEADFEIKKEPWSEVKSSSPQTLIDFGSYESGFVRPSLATKVQYPYEGNCSKSIYNNAATLTQLTPPQSPPQPALTPPQSPPQEPQDVKEIFEYLSSQQANQQPQSHHAIQAPRFSTVYQNIANPIAAPVPAPVNATFSSSPSQFTYTPNVYNATQSSDIAQNCQIVDEIVETRAKELSDWHDDNIDYNSYHLTALNSPPSNDDDFGRSSPSNLSSHSSASSMIGDSSSSSSSDCGGKMQSSSSLAKKRTRPYGRGLEDRKSRKKEQNKNAATRYRQKKKQEMETVLSEEQTLSNFNKELAATLSERKREAKYLKKLIREFCQSKKL